MGSLARFGSLSNPWFWNCRSCKINHCTGRDEEKKKQNKRTTNNKSQINPHRTHCRICRLLSETWRRFQRFRCSTRGLERAGAQYLLDSGSTTPLTAPPPTNVALCWQGQSGGEDGLSLGDDYIHGCPPLVIPPKAEANNLAFPPLNITPPRKGNSPPAGPNPHKG